MISLGWCDQQMIKITIHCFEKYFVLRLSDLVTTHTTHQTLDLNKETSLVRVLNIALQYE